ncbi:MAG: hypothetical protein Q3990_08800, partial [Desulfovibrionaceae bacterium]|nr:hypothetical protein [Desulfovibrionaceae bacterium]
PSVQFLPSYFLLFKLAELYGTKACRTFKRTLQEQGSKEMHPPPHKTARQLPVQQPAKLFVQEC